MSTVICIVDTLWETLSPSADLSAAAPIKVILKISLAMLLLLLLNINHFMLSLSMAKA